MRGFETFGDIYEYAPKDVKNTEIKFKIAILLCQRYSRLSKNKSWQIYQKLSENECSRMCARDNWHIGVSSQEERDFDQDGIPWGKICQRKRFHDNIGRNEILVSYIEFVVECYQIHFQRRDHHQTWICWRAWDLLFTASMFNKWSEQRSWSKLEYFDVAINVLW